MPRPVRLAAAGDVHADETNRDDLAPGVPGARRTVPTSSFTVIPTLGPSRTPWAPVPVFKVAVPVLGRDFFVFELDGVSVRAAA
jgi:hypothetical protein